MNWHSPYVSYWAERWDYAMAHTDNFCAEIRSKDAVDQHEEANVPSFRLGMGQSNERVTDALARIEQRGYLRSDQCALDIGAGTGAFTIPLARKLRKVTSLDISVNMQKFTRDYADAEGLKNIDFILQNWRTMDLDSLHMREACRLQRNKNNHV